MTERLHEPLRLQSQTSEPTRLRGLRETAGGVLSQITKAPEFPSSRGLLFCAALDHKRKGPLASGGPLTPLRGGRGLDDNSVTSLRTTSARRPHHSEHMGAGKLVRKFLKPSMLAQEWPFSRAKLSSGT